MKKRLKIACYGEILWDLFPDGKKLGGAPLNVALRLCSLGSEVSMISRLGDDLLAEETRALLEDYGLKRDFIQEDSELETGAVEIELDNTGSASYTIKKPVAWDAIALTEGNQKIVDMADLFIFGSLATRTDGSKNTLLELLKLAKKPIFDVNLRAPDYDLSKIVALMEHAYLIKMNEDELSEISNFMGINNTAIEEKITALGKTFPANFICVTRGSKGALLIDGDKLYAHPGYPAKVVDTVGAGDAFLAGLLHWLFRESGPEQALAHGCALGALVASQKGANGKVALQQIADLTEKK